jgi:hypothetical protein
MSVRYLSGVLAAAVLVLAGAGCGNRVKVKGVVTLDGNPIPGAIITFIPEGGGGQNATGITKQDGSFRLATLQENDGVNPGTYKVTVVYTEGVDTGPGGNVREVMQAQMKAQHQKKKPPKYVIPPQYSDPNRTVLKQTVPPGDVKLELQSK